MRRVQLPVAGRWYVGMLLLLGAVSMISSNNVVYLMESLLISGLLISLVLSARAARSVRIEIRRRPIRAGGENGDQVLVTNRSWLPVFCLEVEEWAGGKPRRLVFIPYVAARSTTLVPCRATYDRRGSWTWDRLAVSTTYPYGFLRFTEAEYRPGGRLVWPAALPADDQGGVRTAGQSQAPSGGAILEGEVRPMNFDDDPRSIVWTLSARGGDLMVRMRASDRQLAGLTLDLREAPGPGFERRVSELATRVYSIPPSETESVRLTLLDRGGRRQVHGRAKVLDCLALAEAQGERTGT